MNTFFLSLIQPDIEKRKKNLACCYKITLKDNKCLTNYFIKFGNQKENLKKGSKYVKTRFPFLKENDFVYDDEDGNLGFWNGNELTRFDPVNGHPFLFCYEDSHWAREPSNVFLDLLSKSKFERGTFIFNQTIVHLQVKNFKIGKVRYELILFLEGEELDFDEKVFLCLEHFAKRQHNFFYKTTWDLEGKIDDYL